MKGTAMLVPVLGLVLMGVSSCKDDKAPVTCSITDRNSATITVGCTDNTTSTIDAPSDLYPKCQVGQPWESCKW